MKKTHQQKNSRRDFCLKATFALVSLVALSSSGCSIFKGSAHEKGDEFAEEEDSVFDSERKKQDKLSDFVAQTGRKSKSKKSSVRPGDDFLLSDKAKEIYANTER